MTGPPQETASLSARPPSQRASLSDQVADAVLDLIVAEDLDAGAFLPSEARLAERFGVSRVVVREACRTLAARGILEIQHGKGMVVRNWSPDALDRLLRFALRRDPRLFDDLLEVRFSIEVQAAEAAASRATPEQIEQLHAALGATEVVLEDFEQLATMDVAFHEAIFAASGNLVLGFFGSACQSLLVESRRLTYAGSLYRGETSEVALNDHRRILAAIEQHDPGAAREAMLAHLNMTRDVLMEAHRQTRSLSTPLRSEDVLTLAIEKHRGQPRESPQRADESGYSQTSPEGISQ